MDEKRKRGAASLRPQTPCGKINKLQNGDRFQRQKDSLKTLATRGPCEGCRPAALKKRQFAKFQRLSHFGKRKTQMNKKAEAQPPPFLSCAPTTK